MRAFRIADRRHKIFDGTGAKLFGGRWNSPGQAIIYAAETYAGALLEILVHANLGQVPSNQAVVEITIAADIFVEKLTDQERSTLSDSNLSASRLYGDSWQKQKRSCVLLVPSVVTGGRECNVLINAEHEHFDRIVVSDPEPVQWDERFFRRN